MERKQLIDNAATILESAGYSVVKIRNIHTCFDIIAEKKREKILAKIVFNIDSVQKGEAAQLSKLALFLNARPIVIGRVSKNGKLERNVIYERFSVRCMSLDSLENMLFNIAMSIATKGSTARMAINSEKFRQLITLNSTNISKVAEITNISKDTLYRYKREGGFATMSTIQKLRKYFNDSIEAGAEYEEKHAEQIPGEKVVIGRIKMAAIGIKSAPFNIIAKGKNYYEISTYADRRTLAKQSEMLREIFETFESNYPFFVINTAESTFHRIPVLTRKKLNTISNEDELLEEIASKYS